MVEIKERFTAVLKCADGSQNKVDLDVVCAQSVFMRDFSENIEISDT